MVTCRLWGMLVGPETAGTLIITNSSECRALQVGLALRYGDRDFSHVLSTTGFAYVAPWAQMHSYLARELIDVPMLELTIEWRVEDGGAVHSARTILPFHR